MCSSESTSEAPVGTGCTLQAPESRTFGRWRRCCSTVASSPTCTLTTRRFVGCAHTPAPAACNSRARDRVHALLFVIQEVAFKLGTGTHVAPPMTPVAAAGGAASAPAPAPATATGAGGGAGATGSAANPQFVGAHAAIPPIGSLGLEGSVVSTGTAPAGTPRRPSTHSTAAAGSRTGLRHAPSEDANPRVAPAPAPAPVRTSAVPASMTAPVVSLAAVGATHVTGVAVDSHDVAGLHSDVAFGGAMVRECAPMNCGHTLTTTHTNTLMQIPQQSAPRTHNVVLNPEEDHHGK